MKRKWDLNKEKGEMEIGGGWEPRALPPRTKKES